MDPLYFNNVMAITGQRNEKLMSICEFLSSQSNNTKVDHMQSMPINTVALIFDFY